MEGLITQDKNQHDDVNVLFQAEMRVKDLSIKSLNTGDKSAWLKLETLHPEDVALLKKLVDKTFVGVIVYE